MSRIRRGTEERGVILIITGPAASGKTSVARQIAEQCPEPSVHLHGDDFFKALKVGRLRGWEKGSTPQHEVVFEAIGSAAAAYANGGYFVVLDSLVRPRYLDVLTQTIKSCNIELHLVVLRPSLSETRSRSLQRDETMRHRDEILDELHGAFLTLDSFESHVIDNTTLDVDQTASQIQSKLDRGKLRV